MRTIEQIDQDLCWERAALRAAREVEESADIANDEPRYDAAHARTLYHCEKIDALALERSRARYASLCATVERGAFSSRFQVVQDGAYYSILDTREGTEARYGLAFGTLAEATAKEMNHFSHQREQAERYRFNFNATNRAMRPTV